jgi:hypothetical protein
MPIEFQTLITQLLPPDLGIRLTEVIVGDQAVQVQLTAVAPTASCPDCATPSSSVHSHLYLAPGPVRPGRILCHELPGRQGVS